MSEKNLQTTSPNTLNPDAINPRVQGNMNENELKIGDWVKSELSEDCIEVHRITHFDKWGNPCSNIITFTPKIEKVKVWKSNRKSWKQDIVELLLQLALVVTFLNYAKYIQFDALAWILVIAALWGILDISNKIICGLIWLLNRLIPKGGAK